MVAQADALLTSRLSNSAIKLLDLLTNRYHVGIVRESSDASLYVELPSAPHLQAGQRVRFIVAGDQPIVARNAMQRGLISHVSSTFPNRTRIHLSRLSETSAA